MSIRRDSLGTVRSTLLYQAGDFNWSHVDRSNRTYTLKAARFAHLENVMPFRVLATVAIFLQTLLALAVVLVHL